MRASDLELVATAVTVMLIAGVIVLSATNLFKVSQQTMFSSGRLLSSPNLEVYQDRALSARVTYINWSIVEPNSRTNRTVWIKSMASATLYLTTQSWQPVNATTYISVVWDQEGKTVVSQEVREATFTLVVAADVHDIINFSFDITITAEA
jgi:hypothetical protein